MSRRAEHKALLCLLVLLGCSSGMESFDLPTNQASGDSPTERAGTAGQVGTSDAGQAGAAPVANGGASFRSDASSPTEQGGKHGGAPASDDGGQAAAGAGGEPTDEPAASGGAAGASSSHGGSPARAGNSGAAGDTHAEIKSCAEACDVQEDCRIGTQDVGFDCNPATHRCEKIGLPCHGSQECLPAASLWFLDCASDADCFYFVDAVCVSVAGAGKCARLAPGSSIDASGCESPTADAVLLSQFGSATAVLVCANTNQRCEQGECVLACESDAECGPARNGSICELATGSCRCVKDDDCGAPGVSRCNVATGICECSGAADCQELPGSDVCVGGRCGCSSAAVCNDERLFSGTTSICE
jgi:hypothetical protein